MAEPIAPAATIPIVGGKGIDMILVLNVGLLEGHFGLGWGGLQHFSHCYLLYYTDGNILSSN